MDLTRTQCNELKGLAILSIILHNFIHQQRFGFALQNESSFDISRTTDFFSGLHAGIGQAICEIVSFLGWIGVPVFVFLSGYGLAKKYESSRSLSILNYVKHSWLKLFILMLPGILFFMVYMQIKGYGGVGVLAKYTLYLSMLGNLFGLYELTPGVYWYFGLTFELYLIYIVFEKYRSNILLYLGLLIPLIIQCILLVTGSESILHFNLKNFIGWLPIFATGILLARTNGKHTNHLPTNALFLLFIIALCAVLLIVCNISPWCWVLIHFVCVALFLAVLVLIEKSRIFQQVFSFLGSVSSFLFVSHPIARIITNDLHLSHWSIFAEILVYLGITAIIVFIYRYIVNLVTCRN